MFRCGAIPYLTSIGHKRYAMPIPYHRTKKGQAERYIWQNAKEWISLDGIASVTGLPMRAIRDAIKGLMMNDVIRMRGSGRRVEYRFTRYYLERGGWIYQGRDLVYPEDAANA